MIFIISNFRLSSLILSLACRRLTFHVQLTRFLGLMLLTLLNLNFQKLTKTANFCKPLKYNWQMVTYCQKLTANVLGFAIIFLWCSRITYVSLTEVYAYQWRIINILNYWSINLYNLAYQAKNLQHEIFSFSLDLYL